MYKYVFEYPALTKKRNDRYIAYCKALKIAGVGYTEKEAVNNLQVAANRYLYEFDVVIHPVKDNKAAP